MKARISDIVTIAAEMAQIERAAILGNSRLRQFVRARQACYLVAHESGYSYPSIGKSMGRHDSSVWFGADKASIIAERDQVFAAFLDQLRRASKNARSFIEAMPKRARDNVSPFKRTTRIFDHPPTPDWAVDEVDLLSARVAQYFKGVAA